MPIHTSQQVLKDVSNGTHFSIEVIPNFELERELLGFGEGLKILSPSSLARRIRKTVKDIYHLYLAN